MKNNLNLFLLVVCTTLLLSGCGPKTKVTSSWVNNELPTDIKTILIIGLNNNETSRRLWEKSFVRLLGTYKVTAIASSDIQDTPITPDKNAIEQIIKKSKADAVIITHLVRNDTTTNWHPGTLRYEPTSFYGGIYGYYNMAYRAVYTPPTVTTKTLVTLQTKLYDVKSTHLLWSAESVTKNPKLLRSDFENIVKSLLSDMKSKKLFF